MPHYRRSHAPGARFFVTVALADRRATTLTDHIERLHAACCRVAVGRPFRTLAICVLPDNLHPPWCLPDGGADYSARWRPIKGGFPRDLDAAAQRSDSKAQTTRERHLATALMGAQVSDETDLPRHVDYIHFNPIRHGLVVQVCDWPHSSFYRHVCDAAGPAGAGRCGHSTEADTESDRRRGQMKPAHPTD